MMAAMTPASAATGTDGFTILYASQGNIAHHCEVIGSDSYGSEAIVCVDILTGTGALTTGHGAGSKPSATRTA